LILQARCNEKPGPATARAFFCLRRGWISAMSASWIPDVRKEIAFLVATDFENPF
jgi:hypothetical protein